MALPQEKIYTIDDIYNLPEGKRAELIDGQIYYMSAPNTAHQRILSQLHFSIMSYIKSNKGGCEVFPAPFAVFLNKDDTNYVEPDISVVCSNNKLDDKGCKGAPDWIIEITSPSNAEHDYIIKLYKYQSAGVREYWIVDPKDQTITVYFFESKIFAQHYTFIDKIKVNIYDDLYIDFQEISV